MKKSTFFSFFHVLHGNTYLSTCTISPSSEQRTFEMRHEQNPRLESGKRGEVIGVPRRRIDSEAVATAVSVAGVLVDIVFGFLETRKYTALRPMFSAWCDFLSGIDHSSAIHAWEIHVVN